MLDCQVVEQSTPDGGSFIGAEVDAGSLQHKLEDRLKLRFLAGKKAGDFNVWETCQREALSVEGEGAGNLFSRCDHIDAAGGKSAVRHVGIVRGSNILGKGEASLRFDGLQAHGAVRTSAGENDAEWKEGDIFCQ